MNIQTTPQDQISPFNANENTGLPTKISRILYHLVAGDSLNRFEAECIGDHCLNSTISQLSNRHGIIFDRQYERVPNRFGTPTTVIRYSLPINARVPAAKVLRSLTRSRAQKGS